jgi:hypothetical protein
MFNGEAIERVAGDALVARSNTDVSARKRNRRDDGAI